MAERLREMRECDTRRIIALGCPPGNALNALHKARYECSDIEDALRHESRMWLEANGHDRFGGEAWPPAGELPKQAAP